MHAFPYKFEEEEFLKDPFERIHEWFRRGLKIIIIDTESLVHDNVIDLQEISKLFKSE